MAFLDAYYIDVIQNRIMPNQIIKIFIHGMNLIIHSRLLGDDTYTGKPLTLKTQGSTVTVEKISSC
jgi:hypothetical protein